MVIVFLPGNTPLKSVPHIVCPPADNFLKTLSVQSIKCGLFVGMRFTGLKIHQTSIIMWQGDWQMLDCGMD